MPTTRTKALRVTVARRDYSDPQFNASCPREAILHALAVRGWSRYHLVKLVAPHIKPQLLYAFLRGETSTTTEKLRVIMEALGLEIGDCTDPQAPAAALPTTQPIDTVG